MTLYTADLEYQTEANRREHVASSTTLLFEDSDYKTAALESVFRWWRNRHKEIPDYWHRLCAVKLYEIVPQRIDVTGYLPQDHGLRCLEWKYDRPESTRP